MKKIDSISNRLKSALDIRNMKQIELCEKTNINKSSISTYLTGEYEPKQKNIFRMAKVLNVDPFWLMGYDVPIISETQQIAENMIQLTNDLRANRLMEYFSRLNDIQKDEILSFLEFKTHQKD